MTDAKQKPRLLKLEAPTARTRDVRSALVKAAREAKDLKATKAVIILLNERDAICTEYAGVNDREKVYMLETAKHLLLRDMYGR